MNVLEEEKRYKEGKKLAYELIRHGVSNKEVGQLVGLDSRIICNWRANVERSSYCTELYDDPQELERKKIELSKYKGIFGRDAILKRTEVKKKMAQKYYDQGMPTKEICEKLNITAPALYSWGIITPEERNAERSKEWLQEWCWEWDSFMSRLVRPIRLAGEKVE